VGAQLVLLAVIVFAASGQAWPVPGLLRVAAWIVAGAGVAAIVWGALSLGREITPHPAPTPNATLRTDGPYRFVRHPIYSGVLLLAAGLTLASASALKAVAFFLLVVVLSIKARFEEALLVERFPDYESYARRTPRLVPRPRKRSD
jgi:protein-S-isoprenylcysteine O-methyltransferase Ste14